MPDDKKQVEQEDLEQKKPEDTLEVPIDEEGNPKSEEDKKKDEETARIQREEQSKKNAEAAQRRIDQEKRKLKQENETLAKRLAELERKSATPLSSFGATQPVVKTTSYWEKRLAESPVEALGEYYAYQRQQEREAEERIAQQQQMVEGYSKAIEESTNMAYEEIPALKDESSEEYMTFMSILEQHPEWRQSPMGPMKVVREMKKIARESGESKENTERVRQTRIVNQPISGTRTTDKPKSVTLTREQLQYCRENNVKPEDYAKYLVKLSNGEGVTI